MRNIKKIMTTILIVLISLTLVGCASYKSKATSNINSYIKKVETLTSENYVEWVNANLTNPYETMGVELVNVEEGQLVYFIKCLGMVEYEIKNIDETNKVAEVEFKYVDSTDYFILLFQELFTYMFSEDYTEEGVSQIYIDVIDKIEEFKFLNGTVEFTLDEKGNVTSVSDKMFDVVTAGIYEVILGGDEPGVEPAYSEEELLQNLDVTIDNISEQYFMITFTNNNDVPVNPYAFIHFYPEGADDWTYQSQGSIEALAPGATCYALAYNELNEELTSYKTEIMCNYIDFEDVEFISTDLVPYTIKQDAEELDVVFTNNSDKTINIEGIVIVYGNTGDILALEEIYLTNIAPGESNYSWLYLPSDYNEANNTWTVKTYSKVEVFINPHTDPEVW